MTEKISEHKLVLVVDDDDIFREITASSLADKGIQVVQAGNGVQAMEILATNKDVAVVLSDIRMPEMDGLALLKRIRTLGSLPVILATGFSEGMETQAAHALGANGFLAKPFANSELIEMVLRFLEGAEEKNQNCDEDFARVVIDDFVTGKVLKHNIFVRLAKDKFVKIAHEGVDLDVARIQSYKVRGVKHLYLKKKDFREYLSTTLTLAKKISTISTIDKKKKSHFLQHTGNLIVEKVLVEDLDMFAVHAAKEFFETTLDVITSEDDLFLALTALNESSDHLYAHSVGVSLYAIMLARAMGWMATPTTFRIGLAGLFHDIGLKEINRKIVDSPRISLSRDERILYETHPTRSAEILSSCEGIPEEVVQAVVQHHEDVNGFGYPNGIKGPVITPMAKLLTVADIFCEFAIRNPDYPKGMTATEAVAKMGQFRSQSLDPIFFQEFKNLLKID